jgi:formate dehydrogenase major subunit
MRQRSLELSNCSQPQQAPKSPLSCPLQCRVERGEMGVGLNKIAANIKKSRDKSFTEKNAQGQVVNRTNGIASIGSAALDNEECWLYQKFLRSLGLVYIEHQARI